MDIWLLIPGMALITFLLRYSLFALPDLRFPPLVRQSLHYVPTAVLTAIVVPGMLLPDGEHWALHWHNNYLLGGLATIIIAALSRNLLATIGGGLLAFLVLRWMSGQLPVAG
jgi:branched-subunit amino acid transport protein